MCCLSLPSVLLSPFPFHPSHMNHLWVVLAVTKRCTCSQISHQLIVSKRHVEGYVMIDSRYVHEWRYLPGWQGPSHTRTATGFSPGQSLGFMNRAAARLGEALSCPRGTTQPTRRRCSPTSHQAEQVLQGPASHLYVGTGVSYLLSYINLFL